jgi:LCP family protein required for cell wall assembly
MRRKLLIALACLLLLAAGVVGVAWWQAHEVLAQLQAGPKRAVVRSVEPELHKQAARQLVIQPPEPQAQTILLVGSDHRSTGGEGARSDTMILVRIQPDRKRIAMLSIPRDLYVEIPGRGHNRINEAFHEGGEKLLTETVRETFGVEIDHFVEVDFHGFKDFVHALGGIYASVDQRYFNQNVGTPGTNYANIDLQPGYQLLNGEQALEFARYRHDDSDLVRAARQQLLLRTALRQAVHSGLDPLELRRLAFAFARATTSDISGLGQVWSLARALEETPSSGIVRLTVPTSDLVLYGADYLQATPAQLRSAVRAWLGPAAVKKAPVPNPETPTTAKPSPKPSIPTVALSPDYGRGAALLQGVHSRMRVCAPTGLPSGFWWTSTSARAYVLAKHPAVALYATAGSGDNVLWMYTTWQDPPILEQPTTTIRRGGRDYEVWTEGGGRVRQVAWTLGATRVWITNTLEDSLSPAQMLALATSCRAA